MNPRTYLLLLLLPLMGAMAGCAGTQSFGTAARAGDTVTLPVGWLNLKRQNLNVTITPSSGPAFTNVPVRAVINLYPDPSSKLVVGFRTKQDLGNGDRQIGGYINNLVTSQDREWWQSTVLLDLPASLPAGRATIQITDSTGKVIYPIHVDVLPGTGQSNLFNIYTPGTNGQGFFDYLGNFPNALKSMETADRYAVTLNGKDDNGNDIIPHSIQLGFTHTPNVGVPWTVNPTGDLKSAVWSDDGAGNLRVLLTPINGVTLRQTTGPDGFGNGLLQFKFYIAGGVTGLSQPTVKAYDINGNLMSGVTATVTPQ